MSNIAAIATLLAEPAKQQDVIQDALHTMRQHLGMDAAYLSEFVDDHIVFRAIDAPGSKTITLGGTRPLPETYCAHIASGALPELIPDTQNLPFATKLSVTKELGIRAHVSIPITRRDGSLFGMFCCLSQTPNPSLNVRDLDLMRAFAKLAQGEVQRTLEAETLERDLADKIDALMADEAFAMVFQPIFNLTTGTMAGVEALCRFDTDPYRTPDLWFADAARVGRAELLELSAIKAGLNALKSLPKDIYLSLNASPETVASRNLLNLVATSDPKRIVIEVTEHIKVQDWATLDRGIAALREIGARIAIDDAGAGYSGLKQMIRLRPGIIKLDRSLVDHIDDDRARRSLCAAMVHYAEETGAALVAEGIERQQEADALRDLGVTLGQGYLLAKPMPLAALLTMHEAGRVCA